MSGYGEGLANTRSSERLCLAIFTVLLLLSVFSTTSEGFPRYVLDIVPTVRRTLYVSSVVLIIVIYAKRKWKIMSSTPLVIIPIALWSVLSILWSTNLFISVQKVTLSLIMTFSLLAACAPLRGEKVLKAAQYVLIVMVVTSLLVSIIVPSVGITNFGIEGRQHLWRGLFAEKNVAGSVAAISFLLSLFCVPKGKTTYKIFCLTVSLALLLNTSSRTAIIMLVISCAAGGILMYGAKGLSAEKKGIVSALTISCLPVALCTIAVILTINCTSILVDAISDPASVSNRGYIWRPMITYYLNNPVLGSGFGAYWADIDPKIATQTTGWLQDVAQGHSGYLDILVQLGLPGLIMALITFVSWPFFAILRKGQIDISILAPALSLWVYSAGSNMTESGMLTRDTIWYFFLLTSCAILAKDDGWAGRLRRRRRVRSREVQIKA